MASVRLQALEIAKKCNRQTRFKHMANYLAETRSNPEKPRKASGGQGMLEIAKKRNRHDRFNSIAIYMAEK